MIEILKGSNANILFIQSTGKLTDEDYKTVLIPNIERILAQYGKVRVVFCMGEQFHGWEPLAAWDDATFGLKHRNDFEKCAVVGGPKWVEWATRLASHLMAGQVKIFAAEKLDEASHWIEL